MTGKLSLLGELAEVKGYEIHCGQSLLLKTQAEGQLQPLSLSPMDSRVEDESAAGSFSDGLLSEDGQVLGTYLHGLFDSPDACALLLKWAGMSDADPVDIDAIRDQQLNRFADQLEKDLDMEKLAQILGARG